MNNLQLLGLAYKLLTAQPQGQPKHLELNDKDVALLTVKQKKGSVSVLLGSRDTGKTELAYRYAEFLGRPVYAVSPQQKPPSWITWIKLEDIENKVPSMSTLICDDLPAYASNRDYNDSLVRLVERIIPMVRHERMPPEFPVGEVHLVFVSQSAAQADRYILDCDIAFLKPLGLLSADIERPHIASMYRKLVDPEFEGKSELWIRSHAYMLSRTFKGIVDFKKAT